MTAHEILSFWFGTIPEKGVPEKSKIWFEVRPEVDREIKDRFEDGLLAADAGKWEPEMEGAHGRLAALILFDQFPRHIYRGSPRAYSFDIKALSLAYKMLELQDDAQLNFFERAFLYLPLEHSEDLADQEESFFRFRQLCSQVPPELKEYFTDNVKYAERHYEIIERFGRFPHRNAILNRSSTAEELEFLKEPMSSF